MGLDVNRFLNEYMATSVRLSPQGADTNPELRNTVFLAEQKHRTLYVLIDSEGMLYRLPFNDASRSYTFQNIVEEVAHLVSFYLHRPNGTQQYDDIVVDLRCDLQTPGNKALTRKKTDATPSTPKHKHGDPVLAWYNEFSFKHGRSASQGEFDSQRAMGFVLPLTTNQLKARGANLKTATTLSDYLHNPHFKRLVNRVVYENVMNFVRFPTDHRAEGSCVMIRGPGVAQLKTPSISGPIPSHLNFSYTEVDNVIGVISARCRHPLYPERHCDLLVNSTASDGDCFLVLAAARNRAMSPAAIDPPTGWRKTESVDDLEFSNSVTLIRSKVYYDINELYRSIVELNRRRSSPDIPQKNPILAAFVPVILGYDKFDYISPGVFDGIRDGKFLPAYYDHIDCLANLVTSHPERPDQVLVNVNELGRLIMAAHSILYSKIELDWKQSYDHNYAILKERAIGRRITTRNEVRVFAAQLSWALTYFTAQSYECEAPDPFERSPAGFSMWGYEKRGVTEEDGRFVVCAPEDVDLEYLYSRRVEQNKEREAALAQQSAVEKKLKEASAAKHGL
jgi:hypothetical protein